MAHSPAAASPKIDQILGPKIIQIFEKKKTKNRNQKYGRKSSNCPPEISTKVGHVGIGANTPSDCASCGNRGLVPYPSLNYIQLYLFIAKSQTDTFCNKKRLFSELQCSISNDLEWFFDDFNVGTLNYITSRHIRPSETANSCTPPTTTHPVPVSFEFNAARLDDIDGRLCHNDALKRKESGIWEGNDDILLMAKSK